MKAAAGARGKVIEIEEFVPDDQIDPVFYEKTYYAGSRDDGEAYRVFHEALKQTGRVGIGRFTFHNREYLAAVRSLAGKVLGVHTMRFHDEVVSADELELDKPGKGPGKREVEMASQLVKSLGRKFKASDYEDSYREAVLDLINRKRKGQKIELPEPEPVEETSDDLLAALEASVKG